MTTVSDMSVLYLEDEVLIAIDCEDVMREIGLSDITVASSLNEAEKAVDGRSFDLAILDVHLGPNDSSVDLARRLIGGGTPVIFTTGYNETDITSALPQAGFVEKPLSAEKLRRAIDEGAGASVS